MSISQEQFNKLATKKEIEKFAAKDELEKEVNKLDSKIDKLEQKMDNKFDAAVKMFASKEDLKELRQDIVNDVNKKFNKILTAVDGITKQYQEFDIGFVLNQGAHDRFEKKLLKHTKELELLKKN